MKDFIGQFHVFYPWENGKTQYHNCLLFNKSVFKRSFCKAGLTISFVCCMVWKVVNYNYLKTIYRIHMIKDKKGGQIVRNFKLFYYALRSYLGWAIKIEYQYFVLAGVSSKRPQWKKTAVEKVYGDKDYSI